MNTLPFYMDLHLYDLKINIRSRKYGKYVLLYLYDGQDESSHSYKITHELFTLYGRNINNQLLSDFNFLTIFDKEITATWDVFVGSEELNKQFEDEAVTSKSPKDKFKLFKLLESLGSSYGVKKNEYPALVVIDAEREAKGLAGAESFVKITFAKYNAAEIIYKQITSAICAIKEYYGKFERIAAECKSTISESPCSIIEEIGKGRDRTCIYNVLTDYIKRSPLKTQSALADALGINPRTIRRYKAEGKIPRGKAIAMALLLELDSHETFDLFDLLKITPLNYQVPREKTIIECLETHKTLEFANELLKRKGFDPIETKK